MRKLKFVSLFCGGGGLDIGFIKAGLQPVAAYDIAPSAIAHYKHNIGSHGQVCDLSQKIKIDHECDVVVAGAPCQGFSTIGKRDYHDPRNQLLAAAVNHALHLTPRAIVLENVPGLMSGGHRVYLEKAIQKLRRGGYNVTIQLIDGTKIGLAQARKRVVVIATKEKVEVDIVQDGSKRNSLGNVLKEIDGTSDHDPLFLSGEKYSISERISEGMKLCDVRGGESSVHTWNIPEVYGVTTPAEREVLLCIMRLRRSIRSRTFGDADPVDVLEVEKVIGRSVKKNISDLLRKNYLREVGGRIDLKRTFNGKYRRAKRDGVSFTVDTKFGDPSYFLHPWEARGFTIREAARIQGFPDSYAFMGSQAQKFKLLGNAVPPPMAECVGRALIRALRH